MRPFFVGEGWGHHHHGGRIAKDGAIITMGEWQFALTFPYVLNFPYLCRRYAN